MSTTHINRLRCSISNTPGTSGNVVVGAATSAARRTFTAAEDGKSFEPTFEQGNAWEVRTGCVYTHATSTLTRGTLVDSSTGSAIALSAATVVGLHGTAKAMQDLEPARGITSAQAGSLTTVRATTSNLVIVGIGDSHTNGQIPTSVSASDTLGTLALTSPRDKMWNGTGVNAYFKADSQINSTTGAQDPNLSLGITTGSYLTAIPGLIRAAYPLIGDITVANLAVGGASAFSWAGEQSRAYIQANAQANAGDTITIGATTYTFVAAAAAANEVTIGASASATMLNLANAVHLEGSGWGAGTAINASCYFPNPSAAAALRIQAKQSGVAGNSIVISGSSTTRIRTCDQFLTPTTPFTMVGGSATSAIYANGKTALAGGSGIGSVDYFVVTLGTNDALRAGYRGVTMQSELQILVNNIAADFPTAKIIIWRPLDTSSSSAYLVPNVIPAIDALVTANPGRVYSVDVYSIGAGSGNTKMVQTVGGIHATNYGYSVIAQMFARKICELQFP